MIEIMIKNADVRIVSDQMISMSYAGDVSRNVYYLIELFRKNCNSGNSKFRILHFANKNYATWFSVAQVIYDELEKLLNKKIDCKLIPIPTSEWKSTAKRPLDSRLFVDFNFLEENKIFLKSWEERVRLVVQKVLPSILKENSHEKS